MNDIIIKIEKKEIIFETPNDLNNTQAPGNNSKEVENLKVKKKFAKRQIDKKSEHKKVFKNSDRSDIINKRPLRRSQVKFLNHDET